MRTRSLSILATTALAALLGCPIEGLKTPDAANLSTDNGGSVAGDSESHQDAVDAAEDVSWARAELPAGKSALRVLMTDAPLDADSVFVTFCGIFVQASGSDVGADPGVSGAPRGDDGAGGASGGRDTGAGGAPDAPSRAGAGGDGAGAAGSAPPPEGSGGADAGGAGGAPSPESDDGDKAEAEREAAERAERERADAERADAERERADAERERADAERERADAERGAPGDGAGGQSGADPVAPRDDSREDWQLVSQECQTLDLLTLRDGVTEAVGVATLPPGRYGQIRLMLVDASIVVDGVEHELGVPSGMESGLKIQGGFELLDGGATTVTLDFDAGQSVHYTEGSGYRLAPVINVIDVISHGDAAGEPRDPARPGADPGTARPGESGAGGAGSGGAGSGGAGGDGASRPPPPPRVDPPRPGEPPPPPERPEQTEPPKAGDEPRAEAPPPAPEPPAADSED